LTVVAYTRPIAEKGGGVVGLGNFILTSWPSPSIAWSDKRADHAGMGVD
jgi:hypothetical protein